jgi:CheY-like chemotaxis protein
MKKILICDDESDIRDVLEMLIEIEFEVEITHASDGQEGIDILGENASFDLIICDMNMPRKKGYDVFNFNKDANNIPFILLSADADDISDFSEFHSSNSKNTQISKPWKEDELFDKLRPILEATAA